MERATSSLPVPLSPRMSAGWLLWATLEDAVELLHLLGAADDRAHALLGAQPFAQPAAGQVEAAALGGTFEHRPQFVRGEGFGEQVVGAGAHRLDRRGNGGKGAHHYHRRLRMQRLDLFEQLEALAGRPGQIEQQDVDAVAAQHAAGCAGAVDPVRQIAETGDDLAARGTYGSIVIHNQDVHAACLFILTRKSRHKKIVRNGCCKHPTPLSQFVQKFVANAESFFSLPFSRRLACMERRVRPAPPGPPP